MGMGSRRLGQALACPHETAPKPPCQDCLAAGRHALAAIAFLLTEFDDLEVRLEGHPMQLREVAAMLNAFSAGQRLS